MEENRGRVLLYLNKKKPWMTYILIGITVAVYVLELIFGAVDDTYRLVLMGAKFNPLIQAGQYWRFLTSALLHANIAHIAMNMVSLYLWGPTIETLYGKWKMLCIYIISAVMGTALSYFLSPYVSVGASGAIFGLFGTLISIRIDAPDFFKKVFGKQLAMLIGINVLNGILNRGIDNFGHIGGFIGGVLASEMLGTFKMKHSALRTIMGAVLLSGILLAIIVIGPVAG
ncbi:MAG: rhomboid family intramembrane serine protease [Clostridia bacterium]|nr:rhomboid family intramembrane serine protease [Clostridia bacterium]